MRGVDESLVCYIKDNNTGNVIKFNIEKPEGYSDAYQAGFMQQDVRGRSSPFQSFTSSGPRSISFSILLALDYRKDLATQTEAVRNMMKPYKVKTSNSVKAPYVHVKIGNALDIDAVPVTFSAEWEGGYKEGVYRLCTWSFSFTEIEETGTYNNQSDAASNYTSDIPSGYEVSYEGVNWGATDLQINEKVTFASNKYGYQTANEAMNKNAVNSMVKFAPGDYYIINVKGSAVNLASTPGGTGLGWIVL